MSQEYQSIFSLLKHGFDTVIDVRSPSEFALDHVPGAINLPVLDDDERANVGTIYVQESPFLARKIGAAMVFRNAATHIENTLRDFDGGWRPLVYCWRGGQRSGSFSWMLKQIGWRAKTIEGGYQSYRRLVNSALYDAPCRYRLIALDGYTGTAKTALLHRLSSRGVQVLDLEGLAGHRGSLLGKTAEKQPGQKAFETRIVVAMSDLDPSRPVLIEAESSKIGERSIPPSLWAAMKNAPRIQLDAPIEARTSFLTQAYQDILSDTSELRGQLARLRSIRGNATVDAWFQMIAAGEKSELTRALMLQHYDPAYDKSRKAANAPVLGTIYAESLDEQGLEAVAAQIEELIGAIPQVEQSSI